MGVFELLFLAVGLAMDAFAVSVCKGLAMPRLRRRDAAAVGTWFGVFQALMPLLGYLLGSAFAPLIVRFDHWVAFVLLAFLGGNMLWDSFLSGGEDCGPSLRAWDMFLLAVATSVDALAVGVTFAFLGVEILPAVCLIGGVTFALSAAGVFLGHAFGARYKAGAERFGGAVLILMGLKILLEHLM